MCVLSWAQDAIVVVAAINPNKQYHVPMIALLLTRVLLQLVGIFIYVAMSYAE